MSDITPTEDLLDWSRYTGLPSPPDRTQIKASIEAALAAEYYKCEVPQCTERALKVLFLGVHQFHICQGHEAHYSQLTPPHPELIALEQHHQTLVRKGWGFVLPLDPGEEDRRTKERIRRGPEMLASRTPVSDMKPEDLQRAVSMIGGLMGPKSSNMSD